MTGQVQLEIDGPIAVITNDNQEKRNAFSDEMDKQLFDILGELRVTPSVRAVIWRGEGHSWSSGRDVGSIGNDTTGLTHHELMARGHKGIQQLFDLDAPVIVPIQGWAIGGSFQRALLCDIRIAADDVRQLVSRRLLRRPYRAMACHAGEGGGVAGRPVRQGCGLAQLEGGRRGR
jgi:enoyl-CoA hydratase/carnithine racemase